MKTLQILRESNSLGNYTACLSQNFPPGVSRNPRIKETLNCVKKLSKGQIFVQKLFYRVLPWRNPLNHHKWKEILCYS